MRYDPSYVRQTSLKVAQYIQYIQYIQYVCKSQTHGLPEFRFVDASELIFLVQQQIDGDAYQGGFRDPLTATFAMLVGPELPKLAPGAR